MAALAQVSAMTMMIPRILWIFFCTMVLTLIAKIIMIGTDRDGQLSGGRKKCMQFWYKLITPAIGNWNSVCLYVYVFGCTPKGCVFGTVLSVNLREWSCAAVGAVEQVRPGPDGAH